MKAKEASQDVKGEKSEFAKEGGSKKFVPKTQGEPEEPTTTSTEAVLGDENKHRPTLIVIDDASASNLLPAQMGRSPIAQAIQSHRHADMAFIISSQRYHNHNPWLRDSAATISVFPPKGAEEINFLKRDLPIPHENMRRGFAVASANGPHNFIHVDLKNRLATHNFTGRPI